MTIDFDAARQIMVDSQVRTNDVPDLAIQHAMRSLPREALLGPDGQGLSLAYAEAEVEYAPGRWLLRPRDVGKALQALKPKAGERALAIAAPYAAAVLEQMGLSRDPPRRRRRPSECSAIGRPLRRHVVCEGAVSAPPPAWLVERLGRRAAGWAWWCATDRWASFMPLSPKTDDERPRLARGVFDADAAGPGRLRGSKAGFAFLELVAQKWFPVLRLKRAPTLQAPATPHRPDLFGLLYSSQPRSLRAGANGQPALPSWETTFRFRIEPV